ncbi:oxidative damage protection protein [Halomonas sp. FeN2]|uniref:Probable Fe(2+)-trafficking protein n=2 Tax=Halomonadaceae TaxID=28256 RepID=A0ABY8LKB8_9GAMM|nr:MULTISPECIES: oxidative damage protection protein [Halomonas]MBF59904.1 oxidative damage protection protein [Halomonas sp.]MBL1270621.1 oxidative damage protection protein [Halomonas sp.]MDN3562148.1 oxidative damage protection protein [Halomonas neptunia]UBR51205.1 oxidative damage protection protein [Halomonas sp. FeN2]WGI24800.1 oxidative damage protection protein [Halomonas alkaliantarctica]
MSNTVFCRKYQKELEALPFPPLPGKQGQEIQATVSKPAWEAWQALQTRLINEKHLNMLDPESRAYLMDQMQRFLDNQETDQAEGYVPPTQA